MKKILVVLIALLVVMSACKKEDKSIEGVKIGEGTEETGIKETGTSEGGDIGSFFNKISGTPEYKVKYDVKTTSEGNNMQAFQTMVLKGQNVKIEFETEDGKVSSYVVDKKTYACTEAEGNAMCFESPSQETDNSNVDKGNDIRENWQDYDLTPSGVRTIAGTVATCFKYEVMTQGNAEYCFSPDGVPLYIKVESEDMVTEMSAVEYKSSVSDSEFNLPVTPQKIPSYN